MKTSVRSVGTVPARSAMLCMSTWNRVITRVKRRSVLCRVSLYDSAIPPTNNFAEQEIRGAVITRKIGGCNRSERHAHAHAQIASVAQTAHRHGLPFSHVVADWMRIRPDREPPIIPTAIGLLVRAAEAKRSRNRPP